jgi:hypothetical protein
MGSEQPLYSSLMEDGDEPSILEDNLQELVDAINERKYEESTRVSYLRELGNTSMKYGPNIFS